MGSRNASFQILAPWNQPTIRDRNTSFPIGGWHDFRHALTRMMRCAGVNAVVVSGTLGYKKVELAAEVYDRASSTDIGQALHVVGKQLLPTVLPNPSEN